ncbi:hypothetical protein METSCH_B03680 [Metschnikowia aff. pulcherrima]|uniref:Uncharacterized protein n=1 Tax=Metschnikowia aff. pulcherrima TaxID=2163413 RepID=A0A4P6XKD4_9ASCO|nr:hypothetical protein METSCH_B03680 [Metschnikowia aff. pulcherrima]
MHFANLLTTLFLLLSTAYAVPIYKRLYRPSSEVFSVIAHHEGGVFQYHLLMWDGEDLLLNADTKAFFGRVRASQGYILNLPINGTLMNGTQEAAGTANVHVDPLTYKLTTTPNANNATHGFGIHDSKLTYQNSSSFLACPDLSYQGQYHVYWGNNNQTQCPFGARGYTVDLLVQIDAYTNYNPSSNQNAFLNGTLGSNSSSQTNGSTTSNSSVSSQRKKRFFFF